MIPALTKITRLYRRWKSDRLFNRLSPCIPQIVKDCPQLTIMASEEKWKIQQVVPTLSDMEVLVIASNDSPINAILQIPGSKRATASFEHQKKVLSRLHADPRLADWGSLLPHLLLEKNDKHHSYWIFERLPGVNALTVLGQTNDPQGIWQLAAEAIAVLHHKTAKEIIVDEELLENWVFAPIRVIKQSPLVYYRYKSHEILDRLASELKHSLTGRQFRVSWIHGDYWEGNILFSPDGSRVTGIVDWDLARPDDIPSLDLVNLLVSICRMEDGRELGEIVIETHHQGTWPPDKQVIWDEAMQPFEGKTPEIREALLLFWLRHLSANLLKSKRYSLNPIWANKNYRYVLENL